MQRIIYSWSRNLSAGREEDHGSLPLPCLVFPTQRPLFFRYESPIHKRSLRSSPPASLRCAASARRTFSMTPERTQFWKRQFGTDHIAMAYRSKAGPCARSKGFRSRLCAIRSKVARVCPRASDQQAGWQKRFSTGSSLNPSEDFVVKFKFHRYSAPSSASEIFEEAAQVFWNASRHC